MANTSEEYAQAWIDAVKRGDKPRQDLILPKFRMILENLNKKINVLEIGCGWGEIAEIFCSNQKTIKYLGIELNPYLVQYANSVLSQKGFKNFEFLVGEFPKDFKKEDLDAQFDLILIPMVIQHMNFEDFKKTLDFFRDFNSKISIELTAFSNNGYNKIIREDLKDCRVEGKKIIGRTILPNGTDLGEDIIFIHKEVDIEKELEGIEYKKEYLGEYFVHYSFEF